MGATNYLLTGMDFVGCGFGLLTSQFELEGGGIAHHRCDVFFDKYVPILAVES